MFTTPCFIRKNTHELRKKLEELGYVYGGTERTWGELTILYCILGRYYECVQKPSRYEWPKDCGDNEELFLALAALRDDTDINQWFVYNSMDCIIEKLRTIDWFVCEENSIEDFAFYDSLYLLCHKATVEEIIEHFKKE